jgi:hypothetical protein
MFVYDIPYFPPCGIFPPLHILNQVFSEGGGDGGMSPGASWKPFKISAEEYSSLIGELRSTPLTEIKPHARYVWIPVKFDPSFDHIQEWIEWMKAVCRKHRDSWHEELEKAGVFGDEVK